MTPAEAAVIDAALSWRYSLYQYETLTSDTVRAMDPEQEMAGAAATRHAAATADLTRLVDALVSERGEPG